ncbi:hypothetical protein BTHERMOSOX_972 [Bathymodiolus thermophilus thioautotrophic gill symbiont]|nr:hypothetical protein BTHERMOSOX_972 [Bathymodiolus thermophilus thioautotrophic gill symbiont]
MSEDIKEQAIQLRQTHKHTNLKLPMQLFVQLLLLIMQHY